MEVSLNKRYPLAAPPERAWSVLRDLRAVAGCMPGATIDEQTGPQRFKGSIRVKVGPATAQFEGEIEVLGIDEATHRIRLKGKGLDRGGSTAAMQLTTAIETAEGKAGCTLVGNTEVIVNGRFAQFGARMLGQVSDLVMDEFVANFVKAAGPGGESAAAAPPRQLDALTMLWRLVKGWFCRLCAGHCHGRHA